MNTYENKLALAKEALASGSYDKETIEYIFPELSESEDERIRKEIVKFIVTTPKERNNHKKWIAWLEKQGEHANFRNKIQIGDKVTRNEDGMLINLSQLKRVARKNEKQDEQKPTQEIEPFEAEHGKYYYCIKDYFCDGKKQASKGDVIQALRGLPIMELKDASEYFLPVNFIKCDDAWSEEDDIYIENIILAVEKQYPIAAKDIVERLKSLKERYTWKPSDEQMEELKHVFDDSKFPLDEVVIESLYNDLKKLRKG